VWRQKDEKRAPRFRCADSPSPWLAGAPAATSGASCCGDAAVPRSTAAAVKTGRASTRCARGAAGSASGRRSRPRARRRGAPEAFETYPTTSRAVPRRRRTVSFGLFDPSSSASAQPALREDAFPERASSSTPVAMPAATITRWRGDRSREGRVVIRSVREKKVRRAAPRPHARADARWRRRREGAGGSRRSHPAGVKSFDKLMRTTRCRHDVTARERRPRREHDPVHQAQPPGGRCGSVLYKSRATASRPPAICAPQRRSRSSSSSGRGADDPPGTTR